MKTKKFHFLLNDYLFKNVMSNQEYLKYMLSKLFGIEVQSEIKLLDKELVKNYKREKAGIVDLLLAFDNKKYILELQNLNRYNLEERSLYYVSKLYSSELIKNEDYKKLNISGILILVNHDFKDNKLYDECLMKSLYDNSIYSNKIDIRVFNLKHAAKNNNSNDIKSKIAMFIVNDKIEKIEELAGDDKILKEIAKEMRLYNQSKEEYQNMTIWDEKFESEKQEFERIMEVGRQKGEIEGVKMVASNLLKNNVPLELIARATGLSQKEINKIAIMN